MTSRFRRRSAWVTNPHDVVPEWLPEWGFEQVIVHGYHEEAELREHISRYRSAGLDVGGWSWLDESPARAQGERDGKRCLELGLTAWSPNGEALFDGHDAQGRPDPVRFARTRSYLDGLRSVATGIDLLWSALPLWVGDHGALREYGCAFAPQAYPLENLKDVSDVLEHALRHGWELPEVVPQVQVYTTNGQRPPVDRYLDELRFAGVRWFNAYHIGAAMDAVPYLKTLCSV